VQVRWTRSFVFQRGWPSSVTRDLIGRSHVSLSIVGSIIVNISSFSVPQFCSTLLKPSKPSTISPSRSWSSKFSMCEGSSQHLVWIYRGTGESSTTPVSRSASARGEQVCRTLLAQDIGATDKLPTIWYLSCSLVGVSPSVDPILGNPRSPRIYPMKSPTHPQGHLYNYEHVCTLAWMQVSTQACKQLCKHVLLTCFK
jgi:hypothetical protein